jgi:hypothetical protein
VCERVTKRKKVEDGDKERETRLRLCPELYLNNSLSAIFPVQPVQGFTNSLPSIQFMSGTGILHCDISFEEPKNKMEMGFA